MRTKPKLPRKRRLETVAPPDPWSPWIDVAVGIGQAVVACELMFANLTLAAPPNHRGRVRLTLVHSCTVAGERKPHPRPLLRSVRRNEGKA